MNQLRGGQYLRRIRVDCKPFKLFIRHLAKERMFGDHPDCSHPARTV